MITKKTFVTSSTLILTATMLSQIYSFASERFQPKTINYSSFSLLAANIETLSHKTNTSAANSEENQVNDAIIKVIDKEIKKKIIKTRYTIHSYKPKIEVAAKKIIALKAVEAPETITSGDLSTYEINNRELVYLSALSVEQVAYSTFGATNIVMNIAAAKTIEVNDEVVVAQASTIQTTMEADEVKMVQPSPEKIEESNIDEEMVMFDYSEKSGQAVVEKTIDQRLYERPLSSTVKGAINREMGNSPAKNIARMNTQKETARETIEAPRMDEIDLESEENIIYDYSNDTVKRAESATSETEAAINAFAAPAKSELVDTQFVIRAKEINLNTHENRQAHSFEFVPDYERTERTDDKSSGEISLGYSLSGEMNTQTGVVQSQGMISTRVELNLGSTKGIEVPLINEEGIQQFLQKEGLSIVGNLILIALDSSIVDTEIDARFSQRFYFDQKFQPLTSNLDASYVMFAGVKSGNIMIRYLLSNKDIAQKIVYVGDGEMYFEDPSFSSSNRETFAFTTRNLLGQKRKELIIDGSAISFFNTNVLAKKKALNAYEIKVPSMTFGMRKYLEFKHLKDSIFVGTTSEKDIEIPGNDFIAKVLEMNQVNSLKERCVVQINLSKDLRELKANGKNRSGEMFVETSFLDTDGNFSRESEMAEKAFVVGDMEGQFNVRLDYTDGSSEFLKTFCSEGTYLVEQL